MLKNLLALTALVAVSVFPLNALPHTNRIPPPANLVPDKTRKKTSCAPCALAAGQNANPLDNLATLGRRSQPNPLMPLTHSTFDGATVNYVSTGSGALSFAVSDLEISGALPLTFQRAYTSDRRAEDYGLGTGWSFAFDDRITLHDDTATMTTGNAQRLAFRRANNSHFVLQIDEPVPHQAFDIIDDNTINEDASGFTRTYTRIADSFRLSKIADQNGNAINIAFNSHGDISRIAGDAGSFTLEWSKGDNAQLLSVTDSANRRISFDRTAKRLRTVTDANGAQWTYEYKDDQLTRALDPMGRTILRARYDNVGRTIESGDAAGAYSFAYSARRTIVTDPLGAQTAFDHDARGALVSMSDDEGSKTDIERDQSNLPARIVNSSGVEMKFEYDAQRRLTRQTSSDGSEKILKYDERGRIASKTEAGARTDYARDERGNINVATSSDAANSYRAKHDARGHLAALEGNNGTKLAFEHDAAGRETAFASAKHGRFETDYNAAGLATARRLPSGASYRYEYDARGKVTKQSDNLGHRATFERDASGAPTGIILGDNKAWIRATRDAAGRITEMRTSPESRVISDTMCEARSPTTRTRTAETSTWITIIAVACKRSPPATGALPSSSVTNKVGFNRSFRALRTEQFVNTTRTETCSPRNARH